MSDNWGDNWGQDEYIFDENSLKGSRSLHDRVHYGSSLDGPWPARVGFPRRFNNFEATVDTYPMRSSYHPKDNTENRKDFEGVGPRGYKRSDDRIEEEVCNILMKDKNIDASEIEVHVRDGLVTLSGTVESRMEKIEAEMAIENVAGVEDVQNDLKLKKWGEYSDRPYQRNYDDKNPRGDRDKDTYY